MTWRTFNGREVWIEVHWDWCADETLHRASVCRVAGNEDGARDLERQAASYRRFGHNQATAAELGAIKDPTA